MTTEQYTFKAEINELMNMIIHNFYSNTDIFLRELISNASDAINKLKHESLQDKSLLGDFYDFVIKLKLDKEANTLVIEDSGIGMTKEDLINNLGTIAKSGTKEFIKKISNSEDSSTGSNLIGQFGVGFYSAYLVADNVTVITRRAGSEKTYVWESSANGSFNLRESEDEIVRGTKIILHLKPESSEYLETSKITEIVKKHSSYITYPILLHTIKTRDVPVEEDVVESPRDVPVEEEDVVESPRDVPLEEDVVESPRDVPVEEDVVESPRDVPNDDLQVEDVSDDEDEPAKDEVKEPAKKTKTVQEESWEKINSEPLWSKPSSEITEQEYEDFYKSLSSDWEKHLTLKHFKAEGNVEFNSILFIPSRAPNDLFDKKTKTNVKLYVKKVLITDNCKELCPEWLNFISGIVDSSDLPLNASRELLQQSKILKQIAKHLVKKSIEMITDLADDSEKYKKFYENFDKNIKLGIHEEESTNREKLIELLRYTTSKGNFVSFSDYKNRMKESQPGIYYITGESVKGLENSPLVDKLKKLDWEVIYMCDAIDEYIINQLTKYGDVKMINISKDDLQIPQNDSEEQVDLTKLDTLCTQIKLALGDKVESVVVSKKIESQPAIISNPMGMSANMERIMRAQALSSKNSDPMMMSFFNKKTLEISPTHPLIIKLNESINGDGFSELVNVVYESALLSSGYQIEDINSYLSKIYKYMV
jgi:molecular chaperone HtpG